MQVILLEVQLPPGTWAADITRAHEDLLIEVLQHIPSSNPSRGAVKVAIYASNLDHTMKEVRAHPAVHEASVIESGGRCAILHLELDKTVLMPVLQDSAALPEVPFGIQDGRVEWRFNGQREQVRMLLRGLVERGIEHRVRAIHDLEAEPLLTDRQWEVFRAAVDLGYYEVPRRLTLTAMAAQLGMAKSTLNRHLMSSEQKLLTAACRRLRGERDLQTLAHQGLRH